MATAKEKKVQGKDPRKSDAARSPKPAAVKKPAVEPPKSTGGTTTQEHLHQSATNASDDEKRERRKLASGDEKVTVRIPHAYNLHVLVDGGSQIIRYEAGVDEMPRSHAEHQYSVDNGVEIVND